MMRTILYPEWIIDGTGSTLATGQVVIVEGETIQAIAQVGEVEPQPGDQRVDLAGATLIPGLINNHVHAVLPGDSTPFPSVQWQSDAGLALQATHNVGAALSHGVTTVRDCGGRQAIMIEVRDAQARGLVQGARVIACGWPITISGGHVRYFGGEADGTEGVRAMVRKVVSAGADFVKVMASGGGTPGSISHLPSYSIEELKAIVEGAHGLGRKVAAHCTNTASIANAATAGVDVIEHASFTSPDTSYRFDADVARQVADAGIYVTPTLQVFRDMTDILPEGTEQMRWRRMRDGQRDGARGLRELGVRLLAGSDAGWRATTFDTFWKELDELVICGLSPVEAIHAATGAVAQAFGFEKQFGAIRPGLTADLIAVEGDLAHGEMHQLTQLRAIFQGGVRVS